MKRRILLTAGGGFVAPYVLRALSASEFSDAEIFVWCRESSPDLSEYRVSSVNLVERAEVQRSIELVAPTDVLHLAAYSDVAGSLRNPREAFSVNAVGTLNILESLRAVGSDAFFVFVSSADVYGASFNLSETVTEFTLLRPQNPYASSKAAADLLTQQWAMTSDLRTVVLRSFNHTGAGQDTRFAIPSFARQIAEAEKGLRPATLEVGNLEVERDFCHVEDIADAYVSAIRFKDNLKSGSVLNLCSGVPRRMSTMLDFLISNATITVEVKTAIDRVRPTDIRKVSAKNDVAREVLNWNPSRGIEQTLLEVLEYQRNVISNS